MKSNLKGYINSGVRLDGRSAFKSYINDDFVGIGDSNNFGITVSDLDFTTCSDEDILKEGWLFLNQDYGLKRGTNGEGLRWVNYVTDRLGAIDLPIPSLKNKTIIFEQEWYCQSDVWYRRGSIDMFIRANTGRKNSNSQDNDGSQCSLAGFPMYSYSPYDGMSTGIIGINTSGSDYDWMNGDQGEIHMYDGTPNPLHLTPRQGIWKFSGTYDFKHLIYHCDFEVDGQTASVDKTFNNISAEQRANIDEFLAGDLILRINNGKGYGMSEYDNAFCRKNKFIIK